MNKVSFRSLVLAGALVLAPALPALAQSATPSQIQSMISSGQAGQAAQDLQAILAQHPKSGPGWFLMAEAQDAQGNGAAAAQALSKADAYAPGLPFANAQDVATLRSHIQAESAQNVPRAHHGMSPFLLVIGGFLLLFIVLRVLSGFRRSMGGGVQGYPPANMPYGGYGPNGQPPYGPQAGGGMGGGLGSSIVTGLAAGAGFAAGERIVDGLMGGGQAQAQPPQQDFGPGPQDDGLMGNPGWDSSSDNDDDGLNGNSW